MKVDKLAVVGSRFEEKTDEQIEIARPVKDALFKILDRFYAKYSPTWLLSGGATGIDSWAELDSRKRDGVSRQIFIPNWYPNGRGQPMDKGAGYKRNKFIIEGADFVIAMTTGSKGTQNSIDWAKRLKKPLVVFSTDGKVIETANIPND